MCVCVRVIIIFNWFLFFFDDSVIYVVGWLIVGKNLSISTVCDAYIIIIGFVLLFGWLVGWKIIQFTTLKMLIIHLVWFRNHQFQSWSFFFLENYYHCCCCWCSQSQTFKLFLLLRFFFGRNNLWIENKVQNIVSKFSL